MIRNRFWTAVMCACLAWGCSEGGDDGGHPGHGVVRDVDPSAGRVTIAHGDIPGLMKAMTMTFDVADPAALEGIEAGDRVDFELVYAQGHYTVTGIREK